MSGTAAARRLVNAARLAALDVHCRKQHTATSARLIHLNQRRAHVAGAELDELDMDRAYLRGRRDALRELLKRINDGTDQ